MKIIRIGLILMAMFSTQQVLAQDAMEDSRPCLAIAKACKAAGYLRPENADKKFWQGCMKPIILGQTVSGVTVDPSVVKTCRTDKIEKMKKELDEFQKAT